jgi:transposase
MPRLLELELTPHQRTTLEEARDHHPKPYMRERAAALLKVAGGLSVPRVARWGLLRPHDPDTLYRWVHRYQGEGIAGLLVREGRGRKPAFSPSLCE